MKKLKYTANVIKRTGQYLNAKDGTFAYPNEHERLIDGFLPNVEPKYIFAELYEKLGTIQGNTFNQLNAEAWEFVESNKLGYDFEIFIIKK